MSKDTRKKKLDFFDVGSRALSAMSDYRSLYACPICQRLFDVSAIDSGELTLEDSPPRSMGGKPIALTCKGCNSRPVIRSTQPSTVGRNLLTRSGDWLGRVETLEERPGFQRLV